MSRLAKKPFPWFWPVALLFLAATLAAAHALGLDLQSLSDLKDAPEYFKEFRRPDFAEIQRYTKLLGETVVMGLWGSFINLAVALPLTRYTAKNVSPHPVAYRVSREFLNLCRALPDALIALVLIIGLGPGPLGGVLALGIHSIGFLGKAFAESIERLPAGILEGSQSSGATPWQTLRFALWPSVSREIVGYTAYIVYRNILVAVTLGIVGAGGIGVEISKAFGYSQKGKLAALLIMVVIVVSLIDLAADVIRKRIT